MCGIAGFTHKNWSPDPDRIRSATATLHHRGPDQQGVFQSSICSLGAARLKIIDLEGGDQPITSTDGNTTIVFNGEIYNHMELRRELEALGHAFVSHCDTETVLHAFMEWDTDCFRRLRGMFGVALWTESERRLVLARDRIGIKPLYIAQRRGDVFFGSELKAIFVHPEIERNLSMEGLDCYLSMNFVPAPWTLVEGIEKVLPGTWVEWRNGRIISEPYWTLPEQRYQPWTLESAKEEFDSLMRQATSEHLVSDVPLGIWLSGGVDSSTILHYAAQASSARLKTFSISFDGRSFDETPYIKAVVAAYGTEHEQFDLHPGQDLEAAIQEFAYYSDEPSADAGALPVWFLSKMCKARTTVALSGEGADELFGGYLTYRANDYAKLLRKFPRPALQIALSALRRMPVSDEKIGLEYKLKRLLEGSLMEPARAHVYWNGTFSEQGKESLMAGDFPRAMNELLYGPDGDNGRRNGLGSYLRFDQQYYLADDILVKSDRMSMAHSIEVRPPFLDHRIIEFAATLAPALKIRGSKQKFLLKEAMRDKLPQAVLTRKKMGFDIPAHDWFRGILRPTLVDTLNTGLAEYPNLFRADEVNRLLRAHEQRRINVGYHLWGLMILFQWMKRWRIQQSTWTSTRQQLQQPEGIAISI
ncbi:MAG: asparagine synthase (glutamine-hydrolyzing) [Candidatus Korobacteraceae bacterium]